MIPAFDEETGLLPPGIHAAENWSEIEDRFSWNERRRGLVTGLFGVLQHLHGVGCRRIWLGGSFVTAKDAPGDFDVLWAVDGVEFEGLDPVLLDFWESRARQKARFGGDLFPVLTNGADFKEWVRFFGQDREMGREKGIVSFDLGGLP